MIYLQTRWHGDIAYNLPCFTHGSPMTHKSAVTAANDIDQSAALGRRDSDFNFLIWEWGKVIIFQSW